MSAIFENPPSPSGGRVPSPEVLEARDLAMANPGRWVKIGIPTSTAYPSMIKHGKSRTFPGKWNATGRNHRANRSGKTVTDCYIMYLGDSDE